MSANQPPIAEIAAKLKSERQNAGLSIAEVARRANIAKSTLSQLENGSGNPSIETLWAICVVLDIPFSLLLEEPKQVTKVVRYGEGMTVVSQSENYQATLLAACPPNVSRDIYQVEAKPGQPHISAAHNNGVVEHVLITRGTARLGPIGEEYELKQGDYMVYAADQPHIFEALEEGTSAMLVSEYR